MHRDSRSPASLGHVELGEAASSVSLSSAPCRPSYVPVYGRETYDTHYTTYDTYYMNFDTHHMLYHILT